jgi:hypothetical protein
MHTASNAASTCHKTTHNTRGRNARWLLGQVFSVAVATAAMSNQKVMQA